MQIGQVWDDIKFQVSKNEARKAKIQKALFWTVGIIFVLQLYFVRELLAAEMIFGLIFAALLFFAGLVYVVGSIGERGLAWSESYVRVVASSARKGFAVVEEFSRKPFRHPRSESAQ
jgi:hypothetical protein